ncbi:hypothetical protein HanRHA438_Chr03g0140081 [Helianthus annuus]|nr:hypothetical protein HanRHA438_Chr03g0140081 [Helianthus annuus]
MVYGVRCSMCGGGFRMGWVKWGVIEIEIECESDEFEVCEPCGEGEGDGGGED